MSYNRNNRGRGVPRRGGNQRPYDPFGAVEERERRMEAYHANPTFRPQVNYFASCQSRSARGHQQRRHEQFADKKNKEVIEAVTTSTVARFQGHFDSLSESLNTLGVALTPNDVPVPVSSRVVGFSTARIWRRVINTPDLQRRVEANTTVFQIYRVLLASFELKLLDNRKIVVNNILGEFKLFSNRDEQFLDCARPVTIFPTDVAVAISLMSPLTHYDNRYMPLEAKNEGLVLPEQVFFTNLQQVVAHLRDNVDEEFRQRNPLPGARWRQDGRLENADDFWPAGYNNNTLRQEVANVKEWLAAVNAYAPRFIAGSASDGCTTGMMMSSPAGAAKLEGEIFSGDIDDWYSPIAQKNLDALLGVVSLLGEVPEGAGTEWSVRKRELSSRKGSLSYTQCLTCM